MKKLIRIIIVILISSSGFAQQDFETEVNKLAETQVGLNEKVQLSVSGITLSDFISAIALEHNLNISVGDQLNKVVVNNFYDALVKDVLIFLVRQHDLDYEIIGSIIAFKKKGEVVEQAVVYVAKEIKVNYRLENQFLSMDLKHDSLYRVAEAITRKSDKNVILSPDIKDRLVSVYIENRPFQQTMEMFAKANGLKLTADKNDFYYLELDEIPVKNNGKTPKNGGKNGKLNPELDITLSVKSKEKLDVTAVDTPIKDIIYQASEQLGEQYFMYNVPEGNTTLDVEDVTFEELLMHILNNTEYTFRKDEKYYLIGDRKGEGLRATELIQLENRTVETVKDLIPAELLTGIEMKEFVELNGLIVSGSYLGISELKTFLRSVDQIVPMVQIDIIIVQSRKSSALNTGIEAGLSDGPVVTGGTVFPGVDMTFGAETINGLINAFNGFGILNLGAVTPNFYVSLSALESNSIINITSTPKIATLNGHEANFSVGETSYYQEQTVNVSPTISGGNVISNQVWKATDANLNITVKPFVSADEHVTLEITVEQSDFAGRVDPTAPPNKTTQTFSSLIRVKNGEMILMGGLEKDSKTDAGSGTPILSRIPIIKWFFSSRTKEKEKNKLHIFIKTTITY